MNIRDYNTASSRRNALEKERSVVLSNIGAFSLDESAASQKNCENMIGAAQTPMGVAGPLTIHTVSGFTGEYYVPLATTEGALVASVNRGCKAITLAGGAVTDSHLAGATRGPVFKVKDLSESKRLYTYLNEHLSEFQKIVTQTSGHCTLKKLVTRAAGTYRFVRFVFDTDDAMGMNMVTIASQAIARHIEQKTGVTCLSVAGNFDTDKKPSWLNSIENRGTTVWAEVILPAAVLSDVLKTTAQKVFDVWLSKCMIGSAISGSMGFNAQFANVLAALFLATGQDLGHVGEASVGMTTAEVVNTRDLYMSVYLPDLMIGTVGGGTGLATQKEALSILGVAGGSETGHRGENVARFAQIVASAVLAGEVSLLSSLEEGSLSRAHRRLGRGEHI